MLSGMCRPMPPSWHVPISVLMLCREAMGEGTEAEATVGSSCLILLHAVTLGYTICRA